MSLPPVSPESVHAPRHFGAPPVRSLKGLPFSYDSVDVPLDALTTTPKPLMTGEWRTAIVKSMPLFPGTLYLRIGRQGAARIPLFPGDEIAIPDDYDPVSDCFFEVTGTAAPAGTKATIVFSPFRVEGMFQAGPPKQTILPSALALFTCSLAALAASTTGVGRQSTMIDNSVNRYPAALVVVKVKLGTTPTAGSVNVYLLRGDNPANPTYRTDGAGAADAGLSVVNATPLGALVTKPGGPSTGDLLYGEFDTSRLGPLGPEWGIAIVNSTGVALDATEGSHLKEYLYFQEQRG